MRIRRGGLLKSSDASATFAPFALGRAGNRAVFCGTSIALAADSPTNHLAAWPVYAGVMSQQRIRYIYNAGVSGDTTTQMLARFDTDVTPYAPNVVFIGGFTNDPSQGITLDTTQANIRALVAKCHLIGAKPVLETVPPDSTGSPTNRKGLTTRYNHWLREYHATIGATLLDFYALLTDPATGAYYAAYNSGDNRHPSEAGYAAMGSLASTVVGPLLPVSTPMLCVDDLDENNLIANGVFAAASGTSLASPWLDNAGTPAGSALSYTTDSAAIGKLLTITSTATVAVRQPAVSLNMGTTTMPAVAAGATSFSLSVNPFTKGVLFIGSGTTFEVAKVSSVTGSGPYTVTVTHGLANAHSAGEQVVVNAAPGDTLVYTGVCTNDGGQYVKTGLTITGGSGGGTAMLLAKAFTRGVWFQKYVIGTGATALTPYVQVGAGTGVASFGQIGLYNATRMGALS